MERRGQGIKRVAYLLAVAATAASVTASYYERREPASTEQCPPGHVFINWGEIPQTGCFPVGAARALGLMRGQP